jgi:NAD+ diphosphatase
MAHFTRIYPPAEGPSGPPLWAVFRNGDLLMLTGQHALLDKIDGAIGVDLPDDLLIGAFGDRPVRAVELPPDLPVPEGFEPVGLRTLLAGENAQLRAMADYAAQLLRWAKTSRFCPSCGQPMALSDGWGKRCSNCGHIFYPPVSPAIIVLIHDGERVLLTTKTGWGSRYSLVAGFVEPGETFEECVAREVHEEVGVLVDQIEYIKSQSWPFPHQVMVGFLAHYASGEIAIDTAELADARWFARDGLPDLPQPYTIARQIIEHWLEKVGQS